MHYYWYSLVNNKKWQIVVMQDHWMAFVTLVSRYYEGKRSLGASGATVTAPHYQSSYEYRDSYHATPETDILEGRSFQAKSIYWDDYKRVDGPPSASFRGVPAHARPSHISASTTVPPVDWEAGRMPGKQPTHEWDARLVFYLDYIFNIKLSTVLNSSHWFLS